MSKKISIPHICPKCNKTFYTANWNIKTYCSRECEGSAKLPLPLKYCILCDNQIKISPTGNITYFVKRRFCSPHCRGIYAARNRKGVPVSGFGKDHWNWQGGKGTERHKLMNQYKYKQWRTIIFTRDNFTCQICKTKNIKLNADHIKSWAKYPDLRYDINNGRTLCYKCHYEITFNKPIPQNIQWG